ncbi:MAG: alpha/beta hydrolase [Patescibacteria group bacterium]
MKKVFIVHGFEGRPNGGWRPWLMGELEKNGIYACALAMPKADNPILNEWVGEIKRHIEGNKTDQIYLVGHSLGVPAILRYIESAKDTFGVCGAVLVSGPFEKNSNKKIEHFLEKPFDFDLIKSKMKNFAIIHGDTDTVVPKYHAEKLSENLGEKVTWIKDGGHLNGSSGWYILPACLENILKMAK